MDVHSPKNGMYRYWSIAIYLVGGWATPLKNMSSSDWIIIPTIGENKNVPTRYTYIYIFCIISAKNYIIIIIKLKLYKQCETYHLLPPMSWVFKCPRCLNEADRAVKLPSLVLQKRLNGWWRLPTFKCLWLRAVSVGECWEHLYHQLYWLEAIYSNII